MPDLSPNPDAQDQAPPGRFTGPVVKADALSVRYGKNFALKDVTAVFPPGAVGLLGPNGAGKSTLLKSLLGFLVPEKGSMKVLDLDVATSGLEIRRQLAGH